MKISTLQTQVDQYITTTGVRYFNHLTNLGILMEEVGELSRIMVRTYGEQSTKPTENFQNISDEMADILWVLTALANQCGINLEEAMQQNLIKKQKRDANRHINNEKLE
jgi:NTP pyrophosphatase (non-canonical NTP hydrolase)